MGIFVVAHSPPAPIDCFCVYFCCALLLITYWLVFVYFCCAMRILTCFCVYIFCAMRILTCFCVYFCCALLFSTCWLAFAYVFVVHCSSAPVDLFLCIFLLCTALQHLLTCFCVYFCCCVLRSLSSGCVTVVLPSSVRESSPHHFSCKHIFWNTCQWSLISLPLIRLFGSSQNSSHALDIYSNK